MTREEAIEIIDNECKHIKHHLTEKGKAEEFYIELGDMVIAFEMAIIALEKENIYDDREYYITISRALYDKLIVNYDKALSQEPISVSVSEKEPDEISEEVTLRFFKNSLKVRWQDMVIYNVEWLKKNWQMEMDIVCGVKPCTDAVSRQAVLEVSKQHTLTDDYWALQNLPSVNPQPKTGHWIKKDGYSDCSECGSHIVTEWDYCPKCGAKMVEPTCDTCEYNTAAFMPCNACEDKSEYKPQESEVRNETDN